MGKILYAFNKLRLTGWKLANFTHQKTQGNVRFKSGESSDKMNTLAYLYLTFSFMLLFSGIIILVYSMKSDALLGGKIWAIGNFSLFTGLILLSVRSSIPFFFSGILGNFLLILAPTLFVLALGKLYSISIKLNFGLISATLAVLGVGFFNYIIENYGMRMISFALGELAVIIFTLKIILTQRNKYYRKSSALLIIIYFFMALVFLFRIGFGLIYIDKPTSFFEIQNILLVSMVVLIGIITTTSFAFILVSNGVNYAKVHYLAYNDELTNTLNRRAILDFSDKVYSLSNRTDSPLTVMMIDLDKMKKINDTYGHLAGDQAVTSLASIVKQNIRKEDALGRYGGDEFIAILPNTNIDEAKQLAVRLIKIIETDNASQEHQYGHLSASFGLYQKSQEDASFEDLLHKADLALYEAKKLNGNSFFTYI